MELILGEHVIDCVDRTAIMGILNLSDDSPIGESIVPAAAARERALALHEAGAEIIDVGAHSTAAGKREMSAQEEIERVCPVIEALHADGIPVSVDTWSTDVARGAAEAGVHLLNDVTGFSDPAMLAVAAEYRLPAVVMHMRGEPKLHARADQTYAEIDAEVRAFLLERAGALESAGAGQVWLDPGFGFGKSLPDNIRLLAALPELLASGFPLLVSASRKGFLGELLGAGDDQQAEGILEATLAFNTLAARLGAHIVRVHDVAAVAGALAVVNGVRARLRADASERP